MLILASTRISLLNFSVPVIFNSFANEIANDVILLISVIGRPNISIEVNRNYPNCTTILDNWIFENFILADESFAKALHIFETCVSVNNNLGGKLVSLEFPIKFDERFKVTFPFFDADFSFLSDEWDNFTFKVLYLVIFKSILY